MRIVFPALFALSLAATPAYAAPVTVTRFVAPELVAPAHGSIAVTTPSGVDPTALEYRPWLDAVAQALTGLGYTPSTAVDPDSVAEVRVERQTAHRDRTHPPVSVGLGGASGGYHSSFGLGIGFSLGGGPKDMVTTHLSVIIRDRASGKPLWEGRAENTEDAKSKNGMAEGAAPRLVAALFAGFPGKSGETVTVK